MKQSLLLKILVHIPGHSPSLALHKISATPHLIHSWKICDVIKFICLCNIHWLNLLSHVAVECLVWEFWFRSIKCCKSSSLALLNFDNCKAFEALEVPFSAKFLTSDMLSDRPLCLVWGTLANLGRQNDM